ncbi:MAG: YjgB family protein [Alicyclobacillus mali]|uniref:YjgB family protein n=1 Tax=Alicyclobacillus mali (ex Roth et al. 2021) TaxID=1123961 RepID=UPI0023F4D7DB|nr:YjgB family protein [Alicyclobacillus mali (ex Roth et al. 2021)]MCL6488755.1 YjgB family protein [Alicyclobacillus mali (ex Roth et al. 2021)]
MRHRAEERRGERLRWAPRLGLGAAVVVSLGLAGCGAERPANGIGLQEAGTAQPAANVARSATNAEPQGAGTAAGSADVAQPERADAGRAPNPGEMVRSVMQAALRGSLPGVPFADGENIDQVMKAWGSPSSQAYAGAGVYFTYRAKDVAFGLNKGEQIFDVRSYAQALRTLTYHDIAGVLGTPGSVRYTQDSYIYLYPAGPDYQLLWVFPRLPNGSRGPTVDHVSVFWPQGTVDLMAATQPAPGVVIDRPPSEREHTVSFHIANAPKGYRLEEIEWIPKQGDAVFDTWTQAVARAEAHATAPGFLAYPNQASMTFVYAPWMKGEVGQIRVIYQATSGAAMLGNSTWLSLS